ncbi:hypothetical protein GGQ07_003327 [Salinibacter ruber]|uniref:sulfotransferase n=1 Tax=Salinibacter ruber TaxID=146919 RepID=UPI002168E1A1|nr:sulfotransferase [Salinibacter ruber]MCS4181864.1 hypothetical protein [Salinibacter ruber]
MNVGDRYGTMGRLLHRIAFRAGTAQHALSDVEETLYADRIGGIAADDPVFITSLPRSGTTILLKLLWQTGRFASHTYRDMPFVLCPLIWSRYTGQFAGEIEPTERAHGDGIEVSGESPEAFEEMIWKHFWPTRYREDHIRPWSPGDENEEFNSFFQAHMRKVIALRTEEEGGEKSPEGRRYLSKNNLNISRLAALPEPLRKGTLLVPFRDPVQQAASMHRQHERFLQIHEEDDFTREYMEAIGHHEFGKGLKPVNFGGWLDGETGDPEDLSFWLRYWRAAYQFILENTTESTVLVSYARLTEKPETALSRLASALELPTGVLAPLATELRPPRSHQADEESLPGPPLEEAQDTYERLDDRASV